ncbi:9926_t:CDS:2, partial [Cetraspora pellucida]
KEADILRKSLDLLIKKGCSENLKKGATWLNQSFEEKKIKLIQLQWKSSCFPLYGLLVRCGLPEAKRCIIIINNKTQELMVIDKAENEIEKIGQSASDWLENADNFRAESDDEVETTDPSPS